MIKKTKAAFSLIELMVVVLIISVVYTMALVTDTKKEVVEKGLSLSNLPTYLRKTYANIEVKIVCDESCQECSVFLDGEDSEEKLALFGEEIPIFYYLDTEGRAQEIRDFPSKSDSEKSCFVLHKYRNGSIEPMIFSFEKSAIVYGAFFEETSFYKDISDYESDYEVRLNEIRNRI